METHPVDGTLVFSTLPLLPKSCTNPKQALQESISAPLIRYAIGDAGGLISFNDMLTFIKKESSNSFDPIQEMLSESESTESSPRGIHFQPFVFVFGRAFWTVSLYGANVYVDHVMVGLEADHICQYVTGKFVLGVKEDENDGPRLHVIVELVPGSKYSEQLQLSIAQSIRDTLLRLNSEYAHYVSFF